MEPTGAVHRILQIHPTRRCNLRCLHCYSSSGPEERDQLDVELLRRAVIDAGEEGYTVAGFSGGEPVLYRPLPKLLEQAHQCGMLTTVTSNGMLLDERRLDMVRGDLDLLAISLDGIPESHNKMRASDRAFETMVTRLDGVRASGIPFGFIFTLTQYNVHELDWVANFALAQGAKLLQIHPLEIVGRAKEQLPKSGPDPVEAAYAFLEARRIQAAAGDRLLVQLDLMHRKMVREYPNLVFASETAPDDTARPLADIVSPLVIEADGTVVPIEHGFAREHALGSLHDAPLRELAAHWRVAKYASFRLLCSQVVDEMAAPAELPFFNWYEVIQRRAEAASLA